VNKFVSLILHLIEIISNLLEATTKNKLVFDFNKVITG